MEMEEEKEKLDGSNFTQMVRGLAVKEEADLSNPKWLPILYPKEDLSKLGKVDILMPKQDTFYRSVKDFHAKLE